MHKTENKSLWKEEMSYGGDTWYMGRIYEELKITLAFGHCLKGIYFCLTETCLDLFYNIYLLMHLSPHFKVLLTGIL